MLQWLNMSAKYRLPVPFYHFLPKLTHPAVRSLCDSWASCLHAVIAKHYFATTYRMIMKPLRNCTTIRESYGLTGIWELLLSLYTMSYVIRTFSSYEMIFTVHSYRYKTSFCCGLNGESRGLNFKVRVRWSMRRAVRGPGAGRQFCFYAEISAFWCILVGRRQPRGLQ